MIFSAACQFRRRILTAALTAITIAAAGPPVAAQPLDQLQLPPRSAGALTGSQFKDAIVNLPRAEREMAIYREIAGGNIPDFLRTLKPVTITATIASQPRTATLHVLPDYLAVGSDSDYFRIPMSPILAQWAADLAQCSLPTRKMVAAVWSAAPCKLAPSPISPSAAMVTVPVFWDHQVTVQAQRNTNGAPLGTLVGGNKKDVVISPQLATYADFKRAAIYGWHQLNSTPIQPLYFGHEDTYADYSHGIRLVNSRMTLDGFERTVSDVLLDPSVASLLSDEASPFTSAAPPRYNVPPAPATFPYADSFPSSGRELGGWIDRFQTPTVAPFSPPSPEGDGYVLTVRDTSGGIDTTRIGDASDADYFVQCDVYCEYRPALSADGFERIGIFARDDGNGLFCGQNGAGTIKGNNYALTWDSHNGRVQCLKTVNGVPADLLASPVYHTASGWRRMRMDLLGSRITFTLDGTALLSVTDTHRTQGPFGIGYQEQFATNANIRGTRADNFSAARLTVSRAEDWTLY